MATKKDDPNNLTLPCKKGDDKAILLAQASLRPTVQAALTIQRFDKGNFADLGLTELVAALGVQVKDTIDGETGRAEAMLISQAHTLNSIFCNLAQRAALNMGEYLDACETYLKLALRAQSQCRATLETLATVKNPPMVGYVKQANISHGHQQVNNQAVQNGESSHAREKQNPPNELLEKKGGNRLDTGTTGTSSQADPAMATVGEIDRG